MGTGPKFQDHFSTVASRYAEFRPLYPRQLFEWIGSLAPDRQKVWDCATGNGQAAVGLAGFFDAVVATDGSAEQITNATPHPRIKYSVAPAEASGLESDSVDAVTVAQAAHWFDLEKFYTEARRVLRSDGVVVIWCYGHTEFEDERIQRIIMDFYSNIVGPYWPAGRRLIEEHYQSILFPFPEIPVPSFQMKGEFTLDRFMGYLRTWSATQRYMQARGLDPVVELEQSLLPLWPRGGLSPGFRWPIYLRAGRYKP